MSQKPQVEVLEVGSSELCPVLFEREEQERAFIIGFGTVKEGHY